MPNPRPPSPQPTVNRMRVTNESTPQHHPLLLSQIVQHFAMKDSQEDGLSEPIQLGKVLAERAPSKAQNISGESVAENDDVPCQRYLHENLRANWFCTELKRRVCYCCTEMLTDNGLTLEVNMPELDLMDEWIFSADSRSHIYQLNSGQEMLLNLASLRCPCGTPFQQSTQSAICSMCCTATCSAACHKKFAQDDGLCIYHLNFIPAAQPEVHGCRDIRWCVIERSPPSTYLSRVCGPRYLEAITGPDSNTLLIRRGYGQFGQPLTSTMDAMEPLRPEARRVPSIFRRNLCQCSTCKSRQPHAILHSKCEKTSAAQEEIFLPSSSVVLPPLNPLSTTSRPGNPFANITAGESAKPGTGGTGGSHGMQSSRAASAASSGGPASMRGSRAHKTATPILPDILTNAQSLQHIRKITASKLAIEDDNDDTGA